MTLSVVSCSPSRVSCPLSIISGPLSIGGWAVETIEEPNATNEPNDAYETVTNAPTAVRQNDTIEPTNAQGNATIEPIAFRENATNELTLAVDRGPGPSVELSAGIDDTDEKNSDKGSSVQASESIQKGREKVRPARAERLRKLNEEARREAEASMAIRRAHLREQKNKNGKPRAQPRRRAACAGPGEEKGKCRAEKGGPG